MHVALSFTGHEEDAAGHELPVHSNISPTFSDGVGGRSQVSFEKVGRVRGKVKMYQEKMRLSIWRHLRKICCSKKIVGGNKSQPITVKTQYIWLLHT